MGDVKLDYVVPPADLEPYVTVFYHFVADLDDLDEVERADHAQFRFRLAGGDAHYRFADGSTAPAPLIHLLAATTGATRSRARGPMALFGLGLTPAGWVALVGAATDRDQVRDAEALFGDDVRAVAAALGTAADAAAMAALVAPLLRRLVGRGDPATLGFVRAVDAWLAGAPSPDLAELVATTALSRRQVERRCNTLYGAPPKLLARKYRALRAAVALASGSAGIDALLAEGFYDQSHLTREVKQFTGLTPGQLRDAPGRLAQLTMARRGALRGQVGPLVSDT